MNTELGISEGTLHRSETIDSPRGYPDAGGDTQANERSCWICLETEEENRLAQWVQSCKCRGTMKWVHTNCLNRWIEEKQAGDYMRPVMCPQCKSEYIILFPQMGRFATLIATVDRLFRRACPCIKATMVIGSCYWSAVTFGAVTFIQVAGKKEALAVMEKSNSLFLLVGLPAIPVGLILGKMIRWEDLVLRIFRKCSRFTRNITSPSFYLPYDEEDDEDDEDEEMAVNQIVPEQTNPISVARVFVSALMLPTASHIVGRMIFDSKGSNVCRTLLGGLTFIVVKGILKIYLKQQQYIQKKQRSVIDYTEENVRYYMNRNPTLYEGSERARDVSPREIEAARLRALAIFQQIEDELELEEAEAEYENELRDARVRENLEDNWA